MVRDIKLRTSKVAGIRRGADDVIVEWVSTITIFFLALICLYPYLNIVAKSFSDEAAVLSGRVSAVWPVGFRVNAYRVVLNSNRFWLSFRSSTFLAVVGTLINVILTCFVAFAVSRQDLPGSKIITFLYIFTMLFNGGLIPTYLIVIGAGLRNSLWALIIPTLVAPFNMVLVRNFIEHLPPSLAESASIDGARPVRLLFSIILPLCMPVIATVILFLAVGYWNEFFSALIYIDDRYKMPLQVYLREMVMSVQDTERDSMAAEILMNTPQESVRGAAVLCSTLPIICVYPFLQKYYVKGIKLGAVKG